MAQSTFFRIHRFADRGLRSRPTDQELTDALLDAGFDATQLDEVRRHLRADAEWVLQRLLPAFFALPEARAADAEELTRALHRGFDPDEPVASLASAWSRAVSTPPPAGLDLLATAALSDAPVAHVARSAFDAWGVSLEAWNRAAARVAPPSGDVRNPEARSLLLRLHEQLLPPARALLREELVRRGEQQRYRSRSQVIEQPPECPDAALLTWSPPAAVLAGPIASALAGTPPGSPLPSWAEELLPREGERPGDLIRRLTDRGLSIRDDEDASFRANVAAFTPLLDALQLCGLSRSGHLGKTPPPLLYVQEPRRLEPPGLRDALDSLLSFDRLGPAQLMTCLCDWWNANGLAAAVDVLPPVASVAELADAWGITAEALELCRKLREELRSGIRRAENTREVLGGRYEVPPGDVYVGLRSLLDERLDPAVGAEVHPSVAAPLGPPPEAASGGGSGGGVGGVARGSDDLAGAVGEYVAFTLLRRLSGGRVRESAWKGGNRRHFADDGVEGDDNLGYDFEFTLAGRRYQVEVKSTKSRRPSQVQLGPSEVRAANNAVAGGPVTWQIWLVSDVLTNPQVTILANPYEPASRDQFHVDGLGARVRFQLRGR